jgi:multidrug transporter EmrE-like cation transporter
MPLLVVTVAVVLQIAGAIVLKSLADRAPVAPALLLAGIGVVAFLNGLRFLAWGFAHRRYPLSTTYPLAAVFFPLMLAVAYLYGDPVRLPQWLGTGLITAGVVWLTWRVRA